MKSFLWVLFRCKFQFKLKRYLQEKKTTKWNTFTITVHLQFLLKSLSLPLPLTASLIFLPNTVSQTNFNVTTTKAVFVITVPLPTPVPALLCLGLSGPDRAFLLSLRRVLPVVFQQRVNCGSTGSGYGFVATVSRFNRLPDTGHPFFR